MKKEDYKNIRNELKGIGPSNLKGSFHLLLYFSLTILGVYLSLQENILLYLAGQLTLALSFLNSNVLVHELGHGSLLKGTKLNDFFGHLVSIGCILPYGPWKLIHSEHHRWSGNRYKDPTFVDTSFEDVPENTKKVVNFCWKYWIPLLSLSYSFGNFWNYKKLVKLFPRHKSLFLFSIIMLPLFFLALIMIVGPVLFFKVWAPAYYLFLAGSEPMLIGQHGHVDQGDTIDPEFHKEKRYHVKDQDLFTRTVKFPKYFSKYILLRFDRHHIHHAFPDLPCYYYEKVKYNFPNTLKWSYWMLQSKTTVGSTVLFKTSLQTGLFKGALS